MSCVIRTASGERVGISWWAGCTSQGGQGAAFDWGKGEVNHEKAFFWCSQADKGESFFGEDGRQWMGAEFSEWVQNRAWTFGEFGGTFEVGSGEMATWEGM